MRSHPARSLKACGFYIAGIDLRLKGACSSGGEILEIEVGDINTEPRADVAELTVAIIAAYVSNNSVPATELPALISSVHAAIGGLGKPAEMEAPDVEKATPAQIRKSIHPDGLISFIDGKTYQTLKRHLTRHGLDMPDYRQRYGLPADYPSTAPGYSEKRSALARSLGLGQQRRNRGDATPAAEPDETAPVAEPPKRGGRRKKAVA